MRSFIHRIKELNPRVVGFDIDGTLYDEFDFVSQSYKNVAAVMSKLLDVDRRKVYEDLCAEWLQFGSSVNIFQNVAQKYVDLFPEESVQACIRSYREGFFELQLTRRTEYILNYLKNERYLLFLVTDGNSELQRKKINSLGLTKWFVKENIAVSGDYGRKYQKPSPYMASRIEALMSSSSEVVYVGDREVDRSFAHSCGFEFIQVSNMIIWE